ncbi:MAG: YicC family protein [Lachnospiraceae bacterium]|nr:YicC family protein [Lachnospiraceae bacterium]
MINSMTGFGRCEVSKDGKKITVEMKSVNHRYLELNIKMPKKFNFIESEIRNKVKKYLERGKVDIFVSYENLTEGDVSLKYNKALAKEYYDLYKTIGEDFEVELKLDSNVIARSPEVIMMEEQNEDEEILTELLLSAIQGACEKMVETRNKEGEHLKQDLLGKLEEILEIVDFLKERSPQIVQEYREKITAKIEELLDNNQIDESRIAQEVIIFADKICIDEEIVRLESHVKAMRDSLNAGGAVGRKLDFIAQEMNREANTTLSKTTDVEISNRAIKLKTDIEKVREQIQNIE